MTEQWLLHLFFSLPNYIMWCVTGVFPQSSFLDSEANRGCSLQAKEKETKLNPIRGMTEHFCGLMISPPPPCQNPGWAEWFESHGLPRWLLSATCVHHRLRQEPGWCSCGESPVSPDEWTNRKKEQINTLQWWREKIREQMLWATQNGKTQKLHWDCIALRLWWGFQHNLKKHFWCMKPLEK